MLEPRIVYVIVDDDAVRDSICMLLDSYGIAARPYTPGAIFLAKLPPEQGCLLVDVDLPGIDGFELLERLRNCGIAIPAVVMTWAAPTSRIKRAVNRARATLLQKPFRPGELIAAVVEQIS